MAAYPFLSDEWFVEVRRMLDERAIEVAAAAPSCSMNLLVTETPFGDDRLAPRRSVSTDVADWGVGHVEIVDLTITDRLRRPRASCSWRATSRGRCRH